MTSKNLNIRGSLVALVTPMFPDGSIDWPTYGELIEWHIKQGTAALVIMGSTGETATISPADHIQLIRVAVERAAGRIPIIGGTGANSTSEAIELTSVAQEIGVTACLSVVPYYNKPTQEGLTRHFRAVAESCDVPIILYDVPSRTITRMSVDTIVALAGVPNIVGLKDATGDMARANELFARLPSGFSVFSGDDASAAALILLGAQGNISVTANILPAEMHDLCQAALAGDLATVRILSRRLATLNQALFIESNPIPVKWVMARMGMIREGIRLPLTPLSASFVKTVESALHAAGIDLLPQK
ncbi:dihydrodipicolinate synthase [Paraburkholderia hospita]|uniref:4-hydroxy-tetrahydrodipicolinate synthase n=1 Tax=Paraburkholderia hospita TaxID=169430 RepID=A0ABP2PXL8_9BURK|nr:4-hydroxy-tetrahydrodipicolinate synthase [Paraburkholderia hospita]EIN02190.1 dihydrodipicolinate synthase [Paraburkholderia hospita]OUL90150.1 4-hydroxy-tetrahydrodipicolinate synthase [Paraburkholderia hospita]